MIADAALNWSGRDWARETRTIHRLEAGRRGNRAMARASGRPRVGLTKNLTMANLRHVLLPFVEQEGVFAGLS
jgi:hypothetical protein